MSGVERPIGPGRNVERQVQALISTLGEDRVPPPADVDTPINEARRPRDRSMAILPISEHADHHAVGIDGAGLGELQIRLLEHSLVASSPLIRDHLGTEDATVSMLEQLGTLDDQPLFVRVSYHLSTDFAPVSQLWRDTSFRSMTLDTGDAFRVHFGVPLGRVQSSVEAVRSDSRTASSLRVPLGTPMMLRAMVLTGVDDVVRELSFTHFRADRVALHDD